MVRRLMIAAALVGLASPALAENDLPEGVEQLLTCGHTYSLKSQDAAEAGDEGTMTEFFHLSEAVLGQARLRLADGGYSPQQVDDIDNNYALMTGFNYGAGMGEEMLANCLAAADSP